MPSATKKAKVPVLVYHYVEVVQNKDDFIRESLSITPTAFQKELLEMKAAGYTFYFVKDLGNVLESAVENPKQVILTFDDGYGDFYTDAFPILKRLGIKSTVFVNSGLVGQPNYMTQEQVKEIAQSGLVEIGGHGYSHQSLTSISAEEAKKVLQNDVQNIKTTYGTTPISFAYPYGHFDDNAKSLVKEAGYEYAVTLEEGWVVQNDKLLEIPRIRSGLAGGANLGEYLNSLQ